MGSESSFKHILSQLGKMDMLSLCFQVLLLGTGVAFIYGAGVEVGGKMATMWYKQLLWIGLGSFLYFLCAIIDYRKLAHYSWILYVFSLFLLLLVCLIGAEINNARSWLPLGGGLSIQPSEFAKPATLLFLCWAVTHRAWRKSPVPSWFLILLCILPPLGLIVLQPDFGTALVFMPFSFSLAFVKGLRWKWIGLGVLIAILILPFVFSALKPHQQSRVKVFLEPPAHALLLGVAPFISEEKLQALRRHQDDFFNPVITINGRPQRSKSHDNWNAQQSLIAVGSGGMTGKGFLQGTQHILGYLPQSVAPTDFIFSVIAEETGFLGSAILLVGFTIIILCACRTALLACDQLGLTLALGVAVIYATHTFINIGMTVQAAPIIGIPLPFVSYGGSFTLSTMILAGLVQSVHIHHDDRQDEDQP